MKQTRKTYGRVAVLGDARVRRGRGDLRDLVRVRDRRDGERAARGDLAEEDRDLVLYDEARRGDGGLLWLALVIVRLERELLALDAALRVRLGDRELDAVVRRLAERRLLAGERGDVTDQDRIRGRGRGRRPRLLLTRCRGLLLLLAPCCSESQCCKRHRSPETHA
jgi:hypothetical protein